MHHVKAEMLLFSTMLITLHVQIGTCDSFCYGGSHMSFLYVIFLLINLRIVLPFETAVPHCSETFMSARINNNNNVLFQARAHNIINTYRLKKKHIYTHDEQ